MPASEIVIDIKTRIINEDSRLFILFPGKSHKFYVDFSRESKVFLDLPGFDISQLSSAPTGSAMAKMLSRTAKLKSWRQRGAPIAEEPERDLAKYRDSAIPKTRAQLAGAARELYFGLKRGELIVVPGPGYFSDVLVGEIADDPSDRTTYSHPKYGSDVVPARAVRWLAKVPKWNLSEELVKRLQLRSPLVLLERSLREEIYRLSFPNYMNAGSFNAQYETTKVDFSSLDDLNIQLFINHVSAILEKIDQEPDSTSIVTLSEALKFVQSNTDFVPELKIEINSPGTLTTISQKITPLVAVAILALILSAGAGALTAGGQAVTPAEPVPVVRVINSLSPDDPCVIDVNDKVQRTLRRLGADEYDAQCARLHTTQANTGLKTQASVTQAAPTPPAAGRTS